MSSPTQAEDDDEAEEVEFVSEGPIRPLLECIDLLTDSEDEGGSSLAGRIEDKIDKDKAHVVSTLDRLAHKVAQDKKERADKCKAFKEKQILQKAHGQQELACSSSNGVNMEAKRCVDMWLRMPGLKPGVISAGSGRRRAPAAFPRSSPAGHTCPVINCGRVYENVSLLEGHLKRFDHSPCDPAIHLRGSPSELFACVACTVRFQTKGEWKKHVESKISSSSPDGHSSAQTYQRIVCFACPACYLVFNLRDECLQHMSDKNHFTESLLMTEEVKRTAQPVPVPQHVKNRLIALCKDVPFKVRCSLCHQVLVSHQTAQAHFNVHCRQGCAVAKSDKSIVEVVKQLQVRGQCVLCSEIFLSHAEMERHREATLHEVEVNQTMAKALLQYSRFAEIQQTQRKAEARERRMSSGLEAEFHKRKEGLDCGGFSGKRKRPGPGVNASSSSSTSVTAWSCECGLQFSEELDASKHLLAANQVFHQCGVCGKLMGELSVTRLHMSRIHGGAHLSNFLFFCRKCNVETPRREDILLHVSEVHRGHTYLAEKEVPYDRVAVSDAKPCTSADAAPAPRAAVSTAETPRRAWMCRMCEDLFDSEAAVSEHCGQVSSHSFQRFVCGHCPQKFFKESTVRRHCANEHGGEVKSAYFCGLCDSMQFDTEDEFTDHYGSLHSKDYYCVDEAQVVQPPAAAEDGSRHACPCMGGEQLKEEKKATFTRCMRSLAAEGRCRYTCAPCGVSVPSYAQMKAHVHTTHAALDLDRTFDVVCQECRESCRGVPRFHKHYHALHCALEPCRSSRGRAGDPKPPPEAVNIIDAVEVKPGSDEIEDEVLVKVLNSSKASNEGEAHEDQAEEELRRALSLSVEEARESADLEEALQRSVLDF